MSNFNKVAIVTGATGGIGKAITNHLISDEFFVIALGRDIDKLNHLSDKYTAKHIQTYSLDFEDPENIKKTIVKILENHKNINLLVNNAGYVKRGTSDLSENEFLKMMNINLISLFNITKQIVPVMKNNGHGRIINISSLSGIEARSPLGGYAASKHALMGLNSSLHKELAEHNINVTAICPNLVDTNMTKDVTSIDKSKLVPVSDVIKTLDYLISLSPNVSIPEIVLRCKEKIIKDNKG